MNVNKGIAAALLLLSGFAALPKGAVAEVVFDQALQDKLPKSVRDAGKVTVATTAYTPPIVFMGPDNTEIIGLDADIINAFSVMFGVKFEIADLGNFAALIPALKAKRFDMSISGMGATLEREKQLDMIPYMYDGKTIMVQKGNPLGIKTMEDLCGQKVAVGVGTAQEALVKKTSDTKCKTPIQVLSIPKQPEVLIAVRTGRAAATVGGYATGVYTTKHQIQNGVGLEALPEVRQDVGYNTIALAKDNSELRDAVMAAFQKLIDSGDYAKMLAKWELAPLAIENARLNDAANLPNN
ncbi:ABC transporter substrate-binding protein [Ensifer sp. ENS05]|uniref:ABC transporter substrate-binding protein n=1 Tax=Ensifer sp. ENS05 TaxID=2769277 RepID=UPI0017848B17|nr:ABC transporter substrate-binding protein [Ensifer sp. ENS05]MBD9596367.1 ABC transporter substrate-binding protein [Ensifer sp. ENS05]